MRPDRIALWVSGHLQERVVDYCHCGRPFRGRARLRFRRCRPDPALAEKLCVGRRNICSFSSEPHVEASGKGQGQFLVELRTS